MDAGHYNIARIQSWIETNCTSFADSINWPNGFETSANGIVMYTLATFRAAAGLNPGRALLAVPPMALAAT